MKTALLLLEFQNDYFPNGRTPLDKSVDACAKAEATLNVCREKKIPIIHVQHISTERDAKNLFPCTNGAAIYSSLQPQKGEIVIKKHYPNSFKDTNLHDYLKRNQITHLVVCGMMVQATVDATVRAAYDLGFACTILHDACAAQQLEFEPKQAIISAQHVLYAFLAALKSPYAMVSGADDFLQQLSPKMMEAVA